MEEIRNWTYLKEYEKLKSEIDKAIADVLKSGKLILGEQVSILEKNFSDFCGSKFGIGVNSGTDALFLAMRAHNIGPGDEVITVPNTAVATIAAIRATGAMPVFVDVMSDTYLMDVSRVKSKISKNTKALLPVHLFGQAVDMDPLIEIANAHGLTIIEDCAQAHGTQYKNKMTGTFGAIGAFSFYPTKVLGAYGDAGMCITDDPKLAKKIRLLRTYGSEKDANHPIIEGYNSRLDEMQAAILNVKLKYLHHAIAKRQYIAHSYHQGLSPILKTPATSSYSNHTYYLYVVSHPKRDFMIQELRKNKIQVNVHYPVPIHLLPAYTFLGYKKGDFPIAEKLADEIFSLPMYPELAEDMIQTVISTIKKIISSL